MPAPKSDTLHLKKKKSKNQILTNSSTPTISMYLHRGKNFSSNHFARSTSEGRPPLVRHWFNYLHTVNEYQILLLNLYRVHSPTVIWTLNPSPDCYEVRNSRQAYRKDPVQRSTERARSAPGRWKKFRWQSRAVRSLQRNPQRAQSSGSKRRHFAI